METSKNQPRGNFHSHRPNYKHYPPRNPNRDSNVKSGDLRVKIISPTPASIPQPLSSLTPKNNEVLKIIALGGFEEVGRNMLLLEYQNQVIIVDIGLRFPDETMPGIDFIVPNIEYLVNNPEKKILGAFITHGHYDHLGAIPYLIDKLDYPPIYTAPLTRAIILRRQEDFPKLKKLDIRLINPDGNENINLGPFIIQPFHVNHNIPDAFGLFVKTPVGTLILTGDFKFDLQPIGDKPADLNHIVRLADGGVDMLLIDSTNAEVPGYSMSESTIMDNLEILFVNAKGRIILATFSSLISRLQEALIISEKLGRKVAIEGYSMKFNVEVSEKLGYLKSKKGTIISLSEALHLPPQEVTILCTGAQGEDNATLMKVANREHKLLHIEKGDTVIFSSSIVPGNELAVQNLKDTLLKQGAKVFHYKMLDIHASGHAQQEDLKLMMSLTHPKYLLPIHGHYSMRRSNANLAVDIGIPEENIAIPSNGQVVELTKEKMTLTEKFVPANYVMIDGLGVGDVGEVVLRDRNTISQDGIFVVIVVLGKHGVLMSEPEIVSRGFVYMKESQDLLKEARERIAQIVKTSVGNVKDPRINATYIRNNIREGLGVFLFKKTQRRPMVLPIVIEA